MDQKQQLDTDIAAISSDADALAVDVPAALKRLKDETNLTKSILLVGDIQVAHPGDTLVLPINIVSGAFQPTGLQADLVLPAGIAFVSIIAGSSAIAAGKQIQANTAAGVTRFIVFGVNTNIIGKGPVALVTLKVDPAAFKRLYPICMNNPVASDALGNGILVSAISGTVIVQ